MKLKMFFVFVLTFILLPCVGYAEDYYIYNKSDKAGQDKFLDVAVNTLCAKDEVNCKFVCNVDIGEQSEDMSTINPCINFGGIKKLTAREMLTHIYRIPYGNSNVGLELKNNYCPNTNNADDICKGFEEAGDSDLVEEGTPRTCYANLLGMTTGSYNLSFNISFQPNTQDSNPPKLYFESTDSALGSALTFDENNNLINYVDNPTHKYHFYSHDDSTKNEFIREFKNKYYQNNSCPTITFCLDSSISNSVHNWYAEFDSSCEGYRMIHYQTINTSNGNNSGILARSVDGIDGSRDGDGSEINTCEKLLGSDTSAGKDLIKLIKIVKDVIFLLVPILVIIFTIIDFTKAVFSGEDAMKKSQGKLFKRLLIAIIIFLIPSLIKIILWFANLVWPFISTDLCGIL